MNHLTSVDPALQSALNFELNLADLANRISSLPEPHHLVIALWYNEGLRIDQIALIAHMTVGRVERLYAEAVKLLAGPRIGKAA